MAAQRKPRSNSNASSIQKTSVVILTTTLLVVRMPAASHANLVVTTATAKVSETSLQATANTSGVSSDEVYIIPEKRNCVKKFPGHINFHIREDLNSTYARRKFMFSKRFTPIKLICKRSLNEIQPEIDSDILYTISGSRRSEKTGSPDASLGKTELRSVLPFQSATFRRSVNQGSCPEAQGSAVCVCNEYKVSCDEQNLSVLLFRGQVPQRFRHLSAIQNSLKAIPVFTNPTNLIKLSLRSNEIQQVDVTSLGNYPMLVELDLSNNKLEVLNLSELMLPHLLKFNISFNRLKSVSSMPLNLNSLDLYGNEISDISFVSEFTALKSLNASHNKISNIPPHAFTKLINLNDLYLHNNLILNTEFLRHLTKYLRTLDLNNNRISNISPMSLAKSNIVFLFLANNSLTNNKFFIHMNRVAELNLSDNKQLELKKEVFKNKKYLKMMDVAGANLSSIDFVLEIPSLVALGAQENNITCLPSQLFKNYKQLRTLYLSENPLENLFCESSSFFYDNVAKKCRVFYNKGESNAKVEIFMKHRDVNDYFNCMLENHSEYLETCEQKCQSGVQKIFLPSFLLVFTVLKNVI